MVLDHVREFIHVSGYAFNPLDPKRPLAATTHLARHAHGILQRQ
jgi:hypothetical protein